MERKIRDEMIDRFQKAFKQMYATSEDAYNNSERTYGRRKQGQELTLETIRKIVTDGNRNSQAQLSELFFKTNGLYKRIILHYATFLTYSWIVAPYVKNIFKDKISDQKIAQAYYKTADFCATFQIERKCALFATEIFVKGAYYGLMIYDQRSDDVVIQDLPFEYCRSRFKNNKDIDLIEFNLEFFKNIKDDNIREEILSNYPKFIQKAYKKYVFHDGPKWVFIPADMGIYFCFFAERPFFLDLIPQLANLEEYKEIDKNRNLQALKKILVQEIPHDGMKLVFEPQEAEAMHEGAINMLQKNRDVDVITSYAKVNLLDVGSDDDGKTNIKDIQDLIYSSAGMSKELFFATTEAGINYSVNNDLALVMILGQRFAHYFTFFLNQKFETKKVKFKLLILPISWYNSSDYTSRARELASFGYSFLTPILSTGIDQTNLAALKALENDLLNLDEILKPLQSSYTQSGKKAGESMDEVTESGPPSDETEVVPEELQEDSNQNSNNEQGGDNVG